MRKEVHFHQPRTRRLRVEHLEDRRLLAVFTVSNLDDAGTGSLRDAIKLSQETAGPHEINFAVTGTIALASQLPTITSDLTISGPGATQLTLDAGNGPDGIFQTLDGYRVLNIDDGDVDHDLEVMIVGLAITGGDPIQTDLFGSGGGIRSRENVTLLRTLVTGNAAFSGGGVHHRYGTFSLLESTVSSNYAGSGGGVTNGSGADYQFGQLSEFNVERSTISENMAAPGSGDGGGISSLGSLHVNQSTVSDNEATDGGGIEFRFSQDPLAKSSITNSTISGNAAFREGGGLFVNASFLTIHHSTITNNSAARGGGGVQAGFSFPELRSTIVSGNWSAGSPDNLEGQFDHVGSGYNLLGSGDTLGSQGEITDVDPLLGPLADNGGPTLTHALLPGSPAIDASDPAIVFDPNEFDQRGAPFSRVATGVLSGIPSQRIDIGAYEAQSPPSADFIDDDLIDGQDFLAWQRGFGTAENATRAEGNSDDDGDVDHSDLAAWTATYGQTESPPPPVTELSTVSAQRLAVNGDVATAWERINHDPGDRNSFLPEALSFVAVERATVSVNTLVSNAAESTEQNTSPAHPQDAAISELVWLTDEVLDQPFG